MYVITMKNMNKEYFDNFRNDVREALKAVAEKYGVEINPTTVRHGDIDFTITLDVSILVSGTSDANESLWSYYYKVYGFEREDYGKTVIMNNEEFKISGIDGKSKKYPIILTRVRDNKKYRYSIASVKEALSR